MDQVYDYSLLLGKSLTFYYFLHVVIHFSATEAEIRLVWGAPWNIGKFLYIITRYIPFAGAIMMVYRQSLFLSCTNLTNTVFCQWTACGLRLWNPVRM